MCVCVYVKLLLANHANVSLEVAKEKTTTTTKTWISEVFPTHEREKENDKCNNNNNNNNNKTT